MWHEWVPVLVQVATGLFFVGVGWKSISTLERLMEKLETRMERITDRFDDYVPQREFDEKGKMFRARPMHSWASHAADALRYLVIGYRPQAAKAPARKRSSAWAS